MNCASRGGKACPCQVFVVICGAGDRLCSLGDPHCLRRRLQCQTPIGASPISGTDALAWL